MTLKEELHRLVDTLDEKDAPEALDYLRWLIENESETLTAEELARVQAGEAEVERGGYITLDELQQR